MEPVTFSAEEQAVIVRFLDDKKVAEVLGFMIFATTPMAHLMQAAGRVIPAKVEIEHAEVLIWILKHLITGPGWKTRMDEEIASLKQAAAEIQAAKEQRQ